MAWLRDLLLTPLGGSGAARLHLGAFGKHPGWDDHLDDIGLDTEPLLAAKQYLYVQGMGGLIDAGAWERLPQGDALPKFKHIFTWSSRQDLVVGRIWSSSDGKNRTHYPMILCAHFEGPFNNGTIPWIFDRLEGWESACRATTVAAEVRKVIQEGEASARLELDSIPVLPPFSKLDFASRILSVGGADALARISCAMDAFLGAIASGKASRRELGLNLRLGKARFMPQHLRLPNDPSAAAAWLCRWREFFLPLVDDAMPLFLLAALDEPWLDVIAGPLTPKHLVCLRSGANSLPLASEIPFALTDEMRARAEELFPRDEPARPSELG